MIESLTSLLVVVVILGIFYKLTAKLEDPFDKVAQLIIIALLIIYLLKFFGI